MAPVLAMKTYALGMGRGPGERWQTDMSEHSGGLRGGAELRANTTACGQQIRGHRRRAAVWLAVDNGQPWLARPLMYAHALFFF